MVQLVMSDAVKEKLQNKHGVAPEEITEAFLNRERGFLEDTREEHKTDPPTQWFIAKTDKNRQLKVVFIQTAPDVVEIKSTFPPNQEEIRIYEKYSSNL